MAAEHLLYLGFAVEKKATLRVFDWSPYAECRSFLSQKTNVARGMVARVDI